jgi:vanillate O-demethylase monooxygenase subunit
VLERLEIKGLIEGEADAAIHRSRERLLSVLDANERQAFLALLDALTTGRQKARKGTMMESEFVLNAWYAAGWSEEFGRTLVERTICGTPLVFFRREDHSLAVLDGTCPHRQYPLALGRLDGDIIECGYHGIAFDSTGACARVPGAEKAQRAMRVNSHPVVERGGLVWLWTGEPELADESLIAERWLSDPLWTSVHGSKHIRCRARLLVENLLDLSHETFLHAGSIGEAGIAESPITTMADDRHVSANRVIRNVPPAPLFQKAGLSGNIDRGQNAEFWAPGLCLTLASATPLQAAQPTFRWSVIHCVTPETATTTHYFWAVARNYMIGSSEVSEAWQRGADAVFDQDVDALNAQELRVAALPANHIELSIPGDAAALASRKLMRALKKAELERSRREATFA